MFNLLSIDFDYFQQPTIEDLDHYPDGLDLPVWISDIVWGDKYHYYPQLLNVKANEKEVENIREIINKQNVFIPTCVAESHARIYEFIHWNVPTGMKLHIDHVDMHHDIVNHNIQTVDCGNWLRFINKEYKNLSVSWFTTPVSLKTYDIDKFKDLMYNDTGLESLKNKTYDGIFMCKSSTWFPPHLDVWFSKVYGLIKTKFPDAISLDDVVPLRREVWKDANSHSTIKPITKHKK